VGKKKKDKKEEQVGKRRSKGVEVFFFFLNSVTINIFEAPEIRNYILPLPSP